MTLQKAVLSYIASQELTKSEEERLKEAFDSIDEDKNGCISKEELIEGYKMMGRTEIRARLEAEHVMTRLDMNRNGTIDYNEFLVANLIMYNVLTEDKLKKAFDFFDSVLLLLIGQKGDGAITIDELQQHFDKVCDETVIKKLMKEADIDKDGRISYEDFTEMMKTFTNIYTENLKMIS